LLYFNCSARYEKEERGEVEKINAKIMKIPTFYLSSYHSFKLRSRLVGGSIEKLLWWEYLGGSFWEKLGKQGVEVGFVRTQGWSGV
jgi:hypothetical protein